jgi:NAD(P)-dependent dehydrogenase (short-subunit alcohol dehydrogenase family)
MINNAGIAYAPGVEFQSEVWKKIIQINVRFFAHIDSSMRIAS